MSGYHWAVRNPLHNYNIKSVLCNKSADLLLLYDVLDYTNSIKMLNYPHGLLDYHRRLGYKGHSTPQLQNGYPYMINTVSDAFHMLLRLIKTNILMYKIDTPRYKPIDITIQF